MKEKSVKFRMYFGVVKTIVLSIVVLGGLAIVALDVAMLAGVNGINTNPAIASVSLCAAVLIVTVALLVLFNSYYGFKQDKFVAVLGFFVDKIPYDDIICVKQNSETREIYLITKGVKETDGTVGFKVNIPVAKVDTFIAEISKHVGEVVVDIFTPEHKNKNKK